MTHWLITSGPTREFLDPVRFLTNGSSGRMGAALAAAALARGYRVSVVSGPVCIEYPVPADVVRVITTDEMLRACETRWDDVNVLIAAAAPCDFRPVSRSVTKIAKAGSGWNLALEETPDILACLASRRSHQVIVGFALETHNHRDHAIAKLHRKDCDLVVLNDVAAVDADETKVMILDRCGNVLADAEGGKTTLAQMIVGVVEEFSQGIVRAVQKK